MAGKDESKLVFTPLALSTEESNRRVSHLFWRSTFRCVLGLHLAHTQRYQQHLQNRLNRMKVMREAGFLSPMANNLEKKIEAGISTYEHILKQAIKINRALFDGSNKKIFDLVKANNLVEQEKYLESIEKEICGIEEELKCAEEHCSKDESQLMDKCVMQGVTASLDSYGTLLMEAMEHLMLLALKHRNVARQWFMVQMENDSEEDRADFKRLNCLVFYESTLWNETVFASNMLYWNECSNLTKFPPNDELLEEVYKMNDKLNRNTKQFQLDLLQAEKPCQERDDGLAALKSELKLLDSVRVAYSLPGYRVRF